MKGTETRASLGRSSPRQTTPSRSRSRRPSTRRPLLTQMRIRSQTMMASEVVNYCNRQNCINPDQRAFGLKFCLCQNQAGKTYKLSSLRAFFFFVCVCVSVCPWVNQLQASRKADFCLIEVVQVQRRGIPSNADGTVKIFNLKIQA